MPFGARAVALLVSCLMLSIMFASLSLVSVNAADGAVELENPVVIVKGSGSPRSSAVTRSFTVDYYGEWIHRVENSGLKSLTVDICDVTTGAAVEVMHIRIRFAAYDAFPSGSVDLPSLIVDKDRTYEIALTPSGPIGAEASYYHYAPNYPPVADFTYTVDHLAVMVDASASYDVDGYITDYQWDWGDGSPLGSGAITSHDYLSAGLYVLTLAVIDDDGFMATKSETLTLTSPVPNYPPLARFSWSSDRFTRIVVVDASLSHDDDGYITDYQWDWGDGTPNGAGVTATHQYGSGGYLMTLVVTDDDGVTDVCDDGIFFGPPTESEVNVFGYTYAEDGSTVLTECDVVVANLMSGDVINTFSDEYGFYAFEFGFFVTTAWVGDVIQVTAVKGNMSGMNSAVVQWENIWPGYLWLDVHLTASI